MLPKKNRFLELDVFRALMCLQVMLYHYTNHYGYLYHHPEDFDLYFTVHNTGVRTFLILSGYVTMLTFVRKGTLSSFWVTRVIRLYPAYWIGLTLTATTVAIFGLPGREANIFETTVNYTMLQRFFLIKDVDGAYWALAAILLFYFVLSLIKSLKKLDKVEYIVLFWLISAVIIDYYPVPYKHLLSTGFLVDYANLFVAGIVFFKLHSDRKNIYLHIVIFMTLIVRYITADNLNEILVDLTFVILFYLFIYNKLKFIVNKPLLFIGSISYMVYLLHQNIGYVIINYLYEAGINNQYLIVLIPSTIIIALSAILTKLIVQPVSKGLLLKHKEYLVKKKKPLNVNIESSQL